MKNIISIALFAIALVLIIISGLLYFNEGSILGVEKQEKSGFKELPENENPVQINETEKRHYKNNSKQETPERDEKAENDSQKNDNENTKKENRTKDPEIERKNAVWVYANEQSYAEKATSKIKQINSALPNDEKIKYLFISSSAIEIRNNSETKYATAYTYDSVNLTHFDKKFPEMEIYTMLEASEQSMNNLKYANETWIKEMASDINKDIQNQSEIIDGIHFDLEPYTKQVGNLIEEFKSQSDIPTSVAFGSSYEDLNSSPVAKTDLPVLMNYAQGADSTENFGKAFERRSEYFFEQCQKHEQNCLNGILISETSTEKTNIHEYTKIPLEKHQKFKEQSLGVAFFGINYRTGKIPSKKTIQTLAENI